MSTLHRKVGAVCTKCSHWLHANIDLGVEVTKDSDTRENMPDIHPCLSMDDVALVCSRCGHRMDICDTRLASTIGKLNAYGFRTIFSSQGHYRMKESFDGPADLVDDATAKAYRTRMVAERPCIIFAFDRPELTTMERRHLALRAAKAIRPAYVTSYTYGCQIREYTVEVTVTYLVPDDSKTIITETHTYATEAEYDELATFMENHLAKFTEFPEMTGVETISISIPWPDRVGLNAWDMEDSMGESFANLLDNFANRMRKT